MVYIGPMTKTCTVCGMEFDADDLEALLDHINSHLAETIHRCPPVGSGLMPCCQRTPFEVPRGHRMTDNDALVTCGSRQ